MPTGQRFPQNGRMVSPHPCWREDISWIFLGYRPGHRPRAGGSQGDWYRVGECLVSAAAYTGGSGRIRSILLCPPVSPLEYWRQVSDPIAWGFYGITKLGVGAGRCGRAGRGECDICDCEGALPRGASGACLFSGASPGWRAFSLPRRLFFSSCFSYGTKT